MTRSASRLALLMSSAGALTTGSRLKPPVLGSFFCFLATAWLLWFFLLLPCSPVALVENNAVEDNAQNSFLWSVNGGLVVHVHAALLAAAVAAADGSLQRQLLLVDIVVIPRMTRTLLAIQTIVTNSAVKRCGMICCSKIILCAVKLCQSAVSRYFITVLLGLQTTSYKNNNKIIKNIKPHRKQENPCWLVKDHIEFALNNMIVIALGLAWPSLPNLLHQNTGPGSCLLSP